MSSDDMHPACDSSQAGCFFVAIANIDQCLSEVGSIQSGDNTGRNEPGTGEMNYASTCKHPEKNGDKGIIGMEHGAANKGIEGEKAVIEAYRAIDPA
jgi:hydroxypyruvate isomerase